MGFVEGESNLPQVALGEISAASSYESSIPVPLFDKSPLSQQFSAEKYIGPFSILFHIDGLPLQAGTQKPDAKIRSSNYLFELKPKQHILSDNDIKRTSHYLFNDPFHDQPSYDARVAQTDFATAFAQRVRLEQGYGPGHKVAFERDGKTYDERQAEPDKYGLQDAYQAEEDALEALRDAQNALQRHDIQREHTPWKRLALGGNTHGAVEKRIEEALEGAVDWVTQWDRPPVRDAARKVLKEPIKKLFAPALTAAYTVACSVPNGLPTSQTNTPEAPHATPTHLVASPTIGSPNDGFAGTYVPGISGGVPGINGQEVGVLPLSAALTDALDEYGYKPVASLDGGKLVVSETWRPDDKPTIDVCIPAMLEKSADVTDPTDRAKDLSIETNPQAVVDTQLGNGSPQVVGNGDPFKYEYASSDRSSQQVTIVQYSSKQLPDNTTCVNAVVFDAAKSPNPNDRDGTPAMVFVNEDTTQMVGFMANTFSADTSVTIQTTDGFTTFVDGIELNPTFFKSFATTTPAPTFTQTATRTPEITATQVIAPTVEATGIAPIHIEVNLDTVEVIPRWGAATYGLEAEYRDIDLSYERFIELNKAAGFNTALYPYSYKGPSAERELPYITAVFIDAYRKVSPGGNSFAVYKIGVFGPEGLKIIESILTDAYNSLESYSDILSHPVACVRWDSTKTVGAQAPQLVENTTQFCDIDAVLKSAKSLSGKLMIMSVWKLPNTEDNANDNAIRYFAGEPDIINPPPFIQTDSNGFQVGGYAFAVPVDTFEALLYTP